MSLLSFKAHASQAAPTRWPMTGRPAGPSPGAGMLDRLNQSLRGELSAAETYGMALGRLETTARGDPAGRNVVADLRDLRDRHREHASRLRELIDAAGGTPSADSGTWGVWARAVMATASLFGPAAMLKALKEGEEYGLAEYRAHLGELENEAADLVRRELIPATRKQIDRLDELLLRRGPGQ